MLQPYIPQKGIISALVQEQLPAVAEIGIDLAMLVEVGGVGPAAVAGVEVEDHAFANVDEEADVVAASVFVHAWLVVGDFAFGDFLLGTNEGEFLWKRVGSEWGLLTLPCAGCNRQDRPCRSRWLGCRRCHRRKGTGLGRRALCLWWGTYGA